MEELVPKKKTNVRRTVIRLMFSVLALAIVFAIVDVKDLRHALQQISLVNWLIGVVGFLVLHVFSAMKWRFVLSTCGIHVTRSLALRAYGFGLFANLCLPSLVGGDVVRAGVLIKNGNKKEAVVFAALVDRLLDIMGLGVLVVLGFLAAPSALSQFGRDIRVQKWLIVGGAIVAISSLALLPVVLRRLHPRKLPTKLGKILLGFMRAWRTLASKPRRSVAAFSGCLALQAGFVTVNVFLGNSMGIALDARLWFLLWPLAKVAAMAPLSLGGIGIREIAFVGLAGSFANKSLLLAQSLVWESTLVVGGLLFGFYSLMSRKNTDSHDF